MTESAKVFFQYESKGNLPLLQISRETRILVRGEGLEPKVKSFLFEKYCN